MRRIPSLAVLLLALLLPGGIAPSWAVHDGAEDRRERAAAMERLLAMMGELRGHAFTAPVPVESLSREQARAFLLRKMRQEYPPEAIAAEQTTYRHFGLLGPGDDLESLFLDLMVQRAAGFYDPEARRLFIVEGQPWGGMVLAHELAHALQDQLFGIDRMLRASRGDDDRLRAVQAMIEGEAMWLAGRLASRRSASRLLSEVRPAPEAGPATSVTTAPETAVTFPAVLQEELSFPYTFGLAWASAIAAEPEGPPGLDAWFREPPDSTEQILHPERARDPRDRPEAPPHAALPDLSADGYRLVKANSWGEFGMRLVLGETQPDGGAAAAGGWDGDLFAVYETAQGTALVWLSIWDSERDAAEGAQAIETWLRARHADASAWTVERRGRRVAVAEGFEEALSSRVLAGAWKNWDEGEAPRP
jgi:hypothetical protein